MAGSPWPAPAASCWSGPRSGPPISKADETAWSACANGARRIESVRVSNCGRWSIAEYGHGPRLQQSISGGSFLAAAVARPAPRPRRRGGAADRRSRFGDRGLHGRLHHRHRAARRRRGLAVGPGGGRNLAALCAASRLYADPGRRGALHPLTRCSTARCCRCPITRSTSSSSPPSPASATARRGRARWPRNMAGSTCAAARSSWATRQRSASDD